MLTRQDWELSEEKLLAPYAVKSSRSRGRVYPEPEHAYRSAFQRDRDRIIHSTAFRRLEYKTQVFVNHEGDYYRTRLTHTIEVSQIARSIARVLRLNEDLTEAIALAHDLGHTPFGHSGEDALHELMKEHGGFEHNQQGLRVVDKLEKRYPAFEGLNLTFEVREGIIKHSTVYDMPHFSAFFDSGSPSLEAQVVELADEIAYNSHDLDDGLTAGLLTLKQLEKVDLWQEVYRKEKEDCPDLGEERIKYQTVRMIINLQVSSLLAETERQIRENNVGSAESIRAQPGRLVAFKPGMDIKNKSLKEFLKDNLYCHYRVVRMSNKARRFIKQLFNVYLDCPEQLPLNTQKKIEDDLPHRVICDYIAGMTDRFALDEHKKLFGPYERV